MEYIRVMRTTGAQNKEKCAVLINGERNGFEGDVLTVDGGFCEVSLDTQEGLKAKTGVFNVYGTYYDRPQEIKIEVEVS